MYIDICHDDHTYLLEEALELKKLEQLDIFLYSCNRSACENENLVLTMLFFNSKNHPWVRLQEASICKGESYRFSG